MLIVTDNDIKRWLFKEVQDKQIKPLMRYVFKNVVNLSPVDTGQFRASWNMTVGEPNYTTVNEGVDLPPPEVPDLQFIDGEFPSVFIANGKHYGDYLEDGWSKQAPNGMVKVTLANIQVLGRFL